MWLCYGNPMAYWLTYPRQKRRKGDQEGLRSRHQAYLPTQVITPSDPDYPRVMSYPRGSWGPRTITLPPRGRSPGEYDFPSDDEGSDGLDESPPPDAPSGDDRRGRKNGRCNGGRRKNGPYDPDDPDDDDPDCDGGGNALARRD